MFPFYQVKFSSYYRMIQLNAYSIELTKFGTIENECPFIPTLFFPIKLITYPFKLFRPTIKISAIAKSDNRFSLIDDI